MQLKWSSELASSWRLVYKNELPIPCSKCTLRMVGDRTPYQLANKNRENCKTILGGRMSPTEVFLIAVISLFRAVSTNNIFVCLVSKDNQDFFIQSVISYWMETQTHGFAASFCNRRLTPDTCTPASTYTYIHILQPECGWVSVPDATSKGPCAFRSSFTPSKNSRPPAFSKALPKRVQNSRWGHTGWNGNVCKPLY